MTDGFLKLDTVAIASMLSFQYVIDGHSLVREVGRRPWLTALGPRSGDGDWPTLAAYGSRKATYHTAARQLIKLLERELSKAFADSDRITLLLSGGLDSRLAGAVLLDLARRNLITSDIRAVTWGIAESRDRYYGRAVARHLGVEWIPLELRAQHLETNIDVAATQLGGLVSPVHLHAATSLSELDWTPGDKILGATLGNGIVRGQYLDRHAAQHQPIQPRDWLGLMRPSLFADVKPQLEYELAAFRHEVRPRSALAVHECEMLAHYVSGLLLPPLEFLGRTTAPIHQAFSDPITYGFLWSLSPLIRTESLGHVALWECDPELVEIPDARTNRPPKRFSRVRQDRLSPFMHRYPRWIANDLAEVIDETLTQDWFDDTGVFDGVAIRRTWEETRSRSNPHPPTAYVLAWLCTFRRLVESLPIGRPKRPLEVPSPNHHGKIRVGSRPPWGFAGRGADPFWQRLPSIPRRFAAAYLRVRH